MQPSFSIAKLPRHQTEPTRPIAPMHPEFAKSLVGWIGAGVSTAGTFLAQLLPKEIEPWGQLGATGLLIYFLVYAVKHQNKEAREERAKREASEKRWEEKWTTEHESNLSAREKDRETREVLAKAVSDLAAAVKKE